VVAEVAQTLVSLDQREPEVMAVVALVLKVAQQLLVLLIQVVAVEVRVLTAQQVAQAALA
jgi:hypothetical protein